MATPVRMLGQYGILPDADPANIPPNAWTRGNNIRFKNNRVMRAPAFRAVDQGLLQTSPTFVMSATEADGTEYLVLANDDGNLTKWSGGTETDVTPTTGFTPGTSSRAFTGCVLGNVVYINRPDNVPYGLLPTGTDFEVIPAWDTNLRAGALRSFGDYLIAINITDAGTDKPQLLKWSTATEINEFPSSFDSTDLTVLAGENPLSALNGPLIDGLAMRNAFIVYGKNQAFIMTLSNDQFVFNFDKLFDDGGIIAPNCAVEVDGKHYVFGSSDIYVHDGVTKQSIADGSVKNFIFENIELEKTEQFFVYHDQLRTEVGFCFISGDDDASFAAGDQPNRCAAFNYGNNTWSFRDLPNVVGAALVSVDTLLTWQTVMGAWGSQGGTWQGSESGRNRGLVMVKPDDTISEETLFALDGFDIGSRFLFPLFEDGIMPAFVRREGLDLGAVRDYKTTQTLLPIAKMVDDTATMYVRFGAQLTPAGEVTWGDEQTFNPITDYKIDNRVGGRFLAIEFGISELVDFQLSGYDFELTASSHR